VREIPREPDFHDSINYYPLKMNERRNCVFLVDDNADVRCSLHKIFEQAGWEVCGEAENGLDAIEKAERLQPQIIVLDLVMPEMNGLTAAYILKRTMPNVRLILFTMHGTLLTADDIVSAGIDAVFSKDEPITALLEEAQHLRTPEAA
jgi:two-component system, chemotaxis family, chemotaxis protein CheY